MQAQRTLSDKYSLQQALIAVGIVIFATVFLLSINRGMLWFPILSAIAFPLLMIIPFIIFSFKVSPRIKIIIAVLVALFIVPYFGLKDTFYLELAINIAIFAALAIGLNIVVGFAGLLDLGYVAFFAVGAYIWGVFASTQAPTIFKQSDALASPDAFYLFLFIGVILAAIAGIMLGLPVLRVKGDYLAIVTLGFGEMIRILLSNLSNVSSNPSIKINLTNGAQGLPSIQRPSIHPFAFEAINNLGTSLGINFTNVSSITYQFFFYLLVLGFALLAAILATRLDNSPIGRAWTAIREDEVAARAMGVPLVSMKLLAFATGAAFAGLMGVIYASKQTYISPEAFNFNQSIFILVIVIVGGMGSIRGVILGAVVVTLLNLQILPNISLLLNSLKSSSEVHESIRAFFRAWPPQLEPAKYQRFVFGIMLVLMMIFRPSGILPARRRRLELEGAINADDDNLPSPPDNPTDKTMSEPELFEQPHDSDTSMRTGSV